MAKRKAPARRKPLPQEQMLGLLTGHWISQMLFTVAKLGVPDALGTRALAPDAIAQRVGANAAYLRRVLRVSCTSPDAGSRKSRRWRLVS